MPNEFPISVASTIRRPDFFGRTIAVPLEPPSQDHGDAFVTVQSGPGPVRVQDGPREDQGDGGIDMIAIFRLLKAIQNTPNINIEYYNTLRTAIPHLDAMLDRFEGLVSRNKALEKKVAELSMKLVEEKKKSSKNIHYIEKDNEEMKIAMEVKLGSNHPSYFGFLTNSASS